MRPPKRSSRCPARPEIPPKRNVEFDLPADMLALRARARAFVERELIPRERELSQGHQLPARERSALEAAARAADLWNVNVPAAYGGPGYGLLARTMIWEALGAHDRVAAAQPRASWGRK